MRVISHSPNRIWIVKVIIHALFLQFRNCFGVAISLQKDVSSAIFAFLVAQDIIIAVFAHFTNLDIISKNGFLRFFIVLHGENNFYVFLDQNACMQFCVPLFSISLFCCHFCGSKGRQQKSKNDLQVLSKPKINSAPSSAPFSGHHLLLEIQKSN